MSSSTRDSTGGVDETPKSEVFEKIAEQQRLLGRGLTLTAQEDALKIGNGVFAALEKASEPLARLREQFRPMDALLERVRMANAPLARLREQFGPLDDLTSLAAIESEQARAEEDFKRTSQALYASVSVKAEVEGRRLRAAEEAARTSSESAAALATVAELNENLVELVRGLRAEQAETAKAVASQLELHAKAFAYCEVAITSAGKTARWSQVIAIASVLVTLTVGVVQLAIR